MEKLTIVSVDSHATMPTDAWPQYVEQQYHEHLPALEADNESWNQLMDYFAGRFYSPELTPFVDPDDVYAKGLLGVWDPVERLAGMDREGIAAEVVYNGDHRAISPFVDPGTRDWEPALQAAGYRAFHRWMHDAFGAHPDRLLLVGNPGQGTDLDAMVAELAWIADHGYHGAYVPGFLPTSGVPPLSDPWWDPYWAACVDRGLPLYVHAGHGVQMSTLYDAAGVITRRMATEEGEAVDWAQEFLALITKDGDFFADPRPRRPLWQLTLGGVFDRFPDLKLVLTEIRGDWLPATARPPRRGVRNPSRRPRHLPPAERALAHQLPHLAVVHPPLRGRDAPRDRARDDRLRSRLPARGGDLAQHPRVGARRLRRGARGRGPGHARRQRHPLPGPRSVPARRHRRADRPGHLRGDRRRAPSSTRSSSPTWTDAGAT